jgi:two-component system response regulator AlgR
MLKLLIVDDELPGRARLRRMLQGQPGCDVVGEAGSGLEALGLITDLAPDVLLLDISMPGMDGLDLAAELNQREQRPAVIFCTAYEEHALQAFEFEAVDYLVKPVSADRLRQALDRARRFLGMEHAEAFLAATLGGSTELIDLNDVACLVAEDKYTTVYLADTNKNMMISQSLTELERAHPDRFLRVHRNALVSRDRIRGLERGDGGMHVRLDGCGLQPVVSRRQLPAVRRVLKEMQ